MFRYSKALKIVNMVGPLYERDISIIPIYTLLNVIIQLLIGF